MPKKAPSTSAAGPPPADEEEPDWAHRPVDADTPAADVDEVLVDPFEDEEIVGLEEEADFLTALYYGIQGTGKTTDMAAVLNACPEGRLIVCNAEGGMKLRALRAQGIDTSRIAVWPKQGVRPTFDALERLVFKVDADLAKWRANGGPKPWCAFGLDSATELVKLMLDNIAEDGMSGRREIERKAREAGVKPPAARGGGRARFKAERDDYGLVSGQMRSILRKLRYMDLHFLITALVRRDEDEDTGATMYGPATPPALQQDLLGYADVVIRTEVLTDGNGKPEYVGWSKPDENHHAKDRYGVLPERIVNPTVDRLLAAISGEEPVVDSGTPSETPETPSGATEAVDPVSTPDEEEKPAPTARKTRASRAKTSAAARSSATVTARVTEPITAASGDFDNPPF